METYVPTEVLMADLTELLGEYIELRRVYTLLRGYAAVTEEHLARLQNIAAQIHPEGVGAT